MRPPQHFNPRADLGLQGAKVELAREGIGDFNSVDQHQHVVAFGAAQPDLGLAWNARNRHAGDITQDVGDVTGLAGFELFGGDESDRAGIAPCGVEQSRPAGADNNVAPRCGRGDWGLIIFLSVILRRSRHSPNQRRPSDAAQQFQISHGFLPSSATW